jgi:nucleoside phosphorylase
VTNRPGESDGIVTVSGRRPPYRHEVLPDVSGDASAYFGISVDAAVNMQTSSRYRELSRAERLRLALAEQSNMLGSMRGYADHAAFDLRIRVRPESPVPIDVSILGRTWAATAHEAASASIRVRREILDRMPGYLVASAITDLHVLDDVLDPYADAPVQGGLITKREILGEVTRPDAKSSYYFSVSRFKRIDDDWSTLYSILARSSVPLTVAVGIFPVQTSPVLRNRLEDLTRYYGRLARAVEQSSGLYYSSHVLAPEAFAVEAEQVFNEYLHRFSQSAFIVRVQVTAPELPSGLLDLVGSSISPRATTMARGSAHQGGYEIRPLLGEQGRRVLRWNLAALDCYPALGRAEIWARPDSPTPDLRVLSVLGDTDEAACAFGLPIALGGPLAGLVVAEDPASTGGSEQGFSADVVVLTATEVESKALEHALAVAGHARSVLAYGPVNTYSIYGPVGGTTVAHVRCGAGSGGTGAAALTVTDAIRDLKPWAVIAVGIAFGINESEQPIGELLVSESLVTYEMQRVGETGDGTTQNRHRGSTMPASPTLVGRFRDSHLGRLGIRVRTGQLLSGEKLIDNAAFKAALSERFPDAIGGEMEGAGLFAASYRGVVEWLVVKAVSDYAQGKGEDKESRQRYAAAGACRALLEVLGQGGLRRRG